LARAVNCKSIIIYGGRARPDQTGYEDYNINLYSPVHCSPCWYWNFCPNDRMCMKEITAEDVLNAIEELYAVENAPL
jgi:ADP-heptose:LPS heptosyltransferase